MSKPPLPELPLKVREYALASRASARRVFSRTPIQGRAWGQLYCEDAAGVHWTLLGDPDWVRAVRSAAQPLTAEAAEARRQPYPTSSSVPPTDEGLPMALVGEFPMDSFRAEWFIYGWADEWERIGRLVVGSWPGLLTGSIEEPEGDG